MGFGDPHITTLDGFTYTFNGIGEYVLVRSMDDDIEFQGRTAEVGNSGATAFSAIAIGHNGITVQVYRFVITALYVKQIKLTAKHSIKHGDTLHSLTP